MDAENWYLVAAWGIALAAWLRTGLETVRWYQAANGELPLAHALTVVAAVHSLISVYFVVACWFVDPNAWGVSMILTGAVGTFICAHVIRRSGKFIWHTPLDV